MEWKVDLMNVPREKLGVTPPREYDEPGIDDRRQTEQLIKFLVDCKLYEDMKWLTEVLEKLAEIVNNWVKLLAKERFPRVEGNAILKPTGLEFHVAGESIDVVCVGPNFIGHENDFFAGLYDILQEKDKVNELRRFPDEKVPFMRFKFHEISVNLFYARLSRMVVPEDMSDWSVLLNVDDATRFSLNGIRVDKEIYGLVPHYKIFITTLMYVKYWAKKRGVRCNDHLCREGERLRQQDRAVMGKN